MFKYERWSMNNGTSIDETEHTYYTKRSWLIPRDLLNSSLCCYDAAITIKYKLKREIKKDLELVRLHSNGQTRCQLADFHKDFTYDGSTSGAAPLDRLTFILFTEPSWNTEWGGEFVAQNPETGKYYYTTYLPNNGVVVPSHWEHRGCSPNGHTDRLRTTLAFSYRILDT
jgi:hypothetical protein